MIDSKCLEGTAALDASVLIEILAASEQGKKVIDAMVEGRIEAYVSRLSLTEAGYVACRLWGMKEALERINLLANSGYITIVEDQELLTEVMQCKCKIPISLGDCHTLALASKYRLKPVFLIPEKELIANSARIREVLGLEPCYLLKFSGGSNVIGK